jgi:hypothetical protein
MKRPLQTLLKHTIFAIALISTPMLKADDFDDEQLCDWDHMVGQECYDETEECSPKKFRGHIFAIGPEFSYLKRKREGGTRQHGMIYGVRASYDHIKRYKFYWGGQAYYGTGTLHGKTSMGSKLKSQWVDELIEGNLGYTFEYKECPHYSFTPFAGGGYFRESNKFKDPSPLPLKFITEFPYLSYGFFSSIRPYECLSIGLNARIRTMWDARCTVKDDPDFEKIKLIVGDRTHYRIELPIDYIKPIIFNTLEIGIVPFYEARFYGGKENFPFDFYETSVRLYGVNLQIIYRY